MKTSQPQETRIFGLCARFTPEGPDSADRKAFMEFLVAALERLSVLGAQKLARDKARFAKARAASRKLWPLFRDVLQDRIPAETAAKKL